MLLTSTVIACSLLWAIIASVMAYNNGREIHVMAERHNSVVEALRKSEVELDNLRASTSKAFAKHRSEIDSANQSHLAALERIDQLQAKINAIGVVRDPKTGRMVSNKPKMTKENSVGLAVFDEIMGDPMSQLEGLTARLCDEVMANAVTDIVPKPHTLEHGMTVKNPTEDDVKDAIPILKLVTELGKGEVIHCSTSKERQSVRRLLHDAGMTWGNGDSYANKDHSDSEESEHCFSLSEGLQGSVGFFRRMGYTVHRASEFLLPPNSSSQG